MKTKRILAWILTLAMLMTFVPNLGLTVMAEEPTVTQSSTKENTNQAGGIIYTKTSTAKSDGTVDITLTAHTTGVVKQTTSVSPTDIVLVLDVSGSMNEEYSSFSVTTYEEALGRRYTYTTGIFCGQKRIQPTALTHTTIHITSTPEQQKILYTLR